MSNVGIFGGDTAEITFGTPKHQQIVDALVARKRATETGTTNLRKRWERDEEQYFGFISENALDERRKESRKNGEPEYATIHIPYNYAMLMASHTYFTSVLFGRNPIWQVQSREGGAQMKELRMEALLSYMITAGRHLPHYYIWTHDPLRYGYGVLGHYWANETTTRTRVEEVDRTFAGIPIPGKSRRVTIIENFPTFRGIRTYNVHPRDFGWDQKYPIGRFQEGEYCYRMFEMSKLDILSARVLGGKPRYFNLNVVKIMTKGTGSGALSSAVASNTVMDIPKQDHTEAGYTLEVVNLPVDEFYVRLNPRVWGLPGPDRVEKWVFLLADEKVIISAQPLGYAHDMFPFSITQAEVEGYDRAPRSILHTTEALNETLTWLANSHFFNTRQALNDKYLVDPSRIVMSDLMGPNAGRIVRLKPEFYGTKLTDIFQQLPTMDVTAQHLKDMPIIADMMQRAIGINDTIMGAVNTGRRTATEVRSTTTMGINRQKTMVEFNSAIAFDPFIAMQIQTIQQMMDFQLELRIVGDLAQNSDTSLTIDPTEIAGFFDFIPVDGTLPIDRMAQVNVWSQLLQALQAVPQMAMGYDLPGIFGFIAQLAGIRNINRFKLPMSANILPPGMAPPPGTVPLGQKGSDNSGAPVGPQLPGMGPSL